MEYSLQTTMAVVALLSIFASSSVKALKHILHVGYAANCLVKSLALLRFVIVNIWFSSVIVPVMCVNAVLFCTLVEGTENCLVVENVEIYIQEMVVDGLAHYLIFVVSHGTILKLTFLLNTQAFLTVSFFIPHWVVEALDDVVGEPARIYT